MKVRLKIRQFLSVVVVDYAAKYMLHTIIFAMELGSNLKKVLDTLFPSTDPLDKPEFDPVSYINVMFPSEQDLSNIEKVQARLNSELSNVTDEINQLVKEQAILGNSAKRQLQSSKGTITDLQMRIQEMKKRATTSEMMVEDICKDIRSLDFAKKNLTKTIAALKRLGMLSHGLNQLEELYKQRQYYSIAGLLGATSELLKTLNECSDIPSIQQLKKQREQIAGRLRIQILEDFRDMENRENEVLAEACHVVDELGLEFRRDVCRLLCDHFLIPYTHLFGPGQMHAGFEHIDRRYAWLRRTLRDYNQNRSAVFPAEWQLPALITWEFCLHTKEHIGVLLDNYASDTSVLVTALQKTLQFEKDITKRFQAQSLVSDKPQEIDLRPSLGNYEERKYSSPEREVSPLPKFEGVISAIFDPYLTRYCEHEEEKLRENVEQYLAEDTTGEGTILQSGIRLFNSIKSKFNKCLSFSTGATLADLAKVFGRVLSFYAERLASRLPRLDKPVKLAVGEETMIAYIANTSEYCRNTILEMETTVRGKLETVYDIDYYAQQGEFSE